MRKLMIAALVFAMSATVSHAQDIPKADVAVGYSLLFITKGYTLTMNGGSVSAAVNANRWLGIVGDFGAYDGSGGIPGLVGETYTFGPRFSYRRWNRLTPFAQAVIGGGHANSTNGGFLGTNNAFAFGGGAGGDLGLDRAGRFALRGQIEFINFRTNHNFSPDSNTGAVRLSVGVVFRIGRNK
jgi:hypothetical protein